MPESAFEGDGIYQNLRFDLQSFLNGLPQMKNEAATFERLAAISGKLDAYRKAVAALHPCEPVVQTAGKLPEADIVFLDEIFKCNDGVLNALLTALNERKYTNEGRTYPIPTISFFAASNEIPNFNDPEKGDLEQHIFAQLHFELLNCKRPYRLYGMTGMPAESCGNVISLDAYRMRAAA